MSEAVEGKGVDEVDVVREHTYLGSWVSVGRGCETVVTGMKR